MNVVICSDLIIPREDMEALCRLRLAAVTAVDLADLSRFAEWLLGRYGAQCGLAQDLTQSAFESVLKGLQPAPHAAGREGRNPRLVDLRNHKAFLKYLRGAIASRVEGVRRYPSPCVSMPDGLEEIPQLGLSPAEDADWSDLKLQLFAALRQRAPWKLLPTIAAWESVFLYSDRIPSVNGHRKYVGEVRHLAHAIIMEMGWFNGRSLPTSVDTKGH